MPEFATPDPIFAGIDLTTGDVRVLAEDRPDTVVNVTPSDPRSDVDVRVAEQTQVEYARGALTVRARRDRRHWIFGNCGSVDITVRLPAGSGVEVRAVSAGLTCTGRLGKARCDIGFGEVRLERTGPLRVNSGSGAVWATRADGTVQIVTMDGAIRLGAIGGPATIKTANGDLSVGDANGDLQLKTAYGDITVDRALAGVNARTAYGSIRVGEVVHGSIDIATATGELEVGVREGTAAWLDARSDYGEVRTMLDSTHGPGSAAETAEIRARTSYGDILIRRA